MGILRSVITQNVDGLHQAVGSRRVIEYHGNPRDLVCVACWMRYPSLRKIAEGIPPRCACGAILKPDIVFFGEPIPWPAQDRPRRRPDVRHCRDRHLRGSFLRLEIAGSGARIIEISERLR
jgi:NAD-dependent SIR2 family protein deacetylase